MPLPRRRAMAPEAKRFLDKSIAMTIVLLHHRQHGLAPRRPWEISSFLTDPSVKILGRTPVWSALRVPGRAGTPINSTISV
jgi:hypothetical protein